MSATTTSIFSYSNLSLWTIFKHIFLTRIPFDSSVAAHMIYYYWFQWNWSEKHEMFSSVVFAHTFFGKNIFKSSDAVAKENENKRHTKFHLKIHTHPQLPTVFQYSSNSRVLHSLMYATHKSVECWARMLDHLWTYVPIDFVIVMLLGVFSILKSTTFRFSRLSFSILSRKHIFDLFNLLHHNRYIEGRFIHFTTQLFLDFLKCFLSITLNSILISWKFWINKQTWFT